MADMELKLEVMEAQVDACQDISETYLRKERQFKDEILLLNVDKDKLQKELRDEKIRLNAEIERARQDSQTMLEEKDKEFKVYKEMLEQEIDVL